MFRKELINLLKENPLGISEMAEITQVKYKEIEEDIEHLIQSLKHLDYRLRVKPAECKNCGFKFSKNKIHRPSKCPKCKQQFITEPLLSIEKIHDKNKRQTLTKK